MVPAPLPPPPPCPLSHARLVLHVVFEAGVLVGQRAPQLDAARRQRPAHAARRAVRHPKVALPRARGAGAQLLALHQRDRQVLLEQLLGHVQADDPCSAPCIRMVVRVPVHRTYVSSKRCGYGLGRSSRSAAALRTALLVSCQQLRRT